MKEVAVGTLPVSIVGRGCVMPGKGICGKSTHWQEVGGRKGPLSSPGGTGGDTLSRERQAAYLVPTLKKGRSIGCCPGALRHLQQRAWNISLMAKDTQNGPKPPGR